MGELCDLGGALVADVRRERRDEHERALHVLRHLFPVCADAGNAPLVKGRDGRREKARGLQKVINAHRQKHIQLKVPLRCSKAHGGIVAEHLHCGHRDLLALRGVDLARHDGRAGLVFWDEDLAQPAARPGSEPADVVGDLHHVARKRLERAVGEHELRAGRERVEFIFRRHEFVAAQCADALGGEAVEACRGVQPRADGGAAESERAQRLHGGAQQLNIRFDARAPAGDLLRKAKRHSVLQMRPPDLQHIRVFRFQPPERLRKALTDREKVFLQGNNGGDVHGGRERIVGGLRHVHVVVRVQQFLSGNGVAAVCHDLIDVHVRLRAAAGLEYDEREIAVQFSGEDLVARARDGGALLFGHALRHKRLVGLRRRLFQHGKGAEDLLRHRFMARSGGEVPAAAFGLRAPVFVGGNGDLAHGIVFDTHFLFRHVMSFSL